ncbi:hypothetical protein QE152_g14304 [Popillia japonica]|uniref:Uncharacterized protein n=1 Tax=Popillia japonica TaxID=7064 RepID=A0AAW1L7C4_POPJA
MNNKRLPLPDSVDANDLNKHFAGVRNSSPDRDLINSYSSRSLNLNREKFELVQITDHDIIKAVDKVKSKAAGREKFELVQITDHDIIKAVDKLRTGHHQDCPTMGTQLGKQHRKPFRIAQPWEHSWASNTGNHVTCFITFSKSTGPSRTRGILVSCITAKFANRLWITHPFNSFFIGDNIYAILSLQIIQEQLQSLQGVFSGHEPS